MASNGKTEEIRDCCSASAGQEVKCVVKETISSKPNVDCSGGGGGCCASAGEEDEQSKANDGGCCPGSSGVAASRQECCSEDKPQIGGCCSASNEDVALARSCCSEDKSKGANCCSGNIDNAVLPQKSCFEDKSESVSKCAKSEGVEQVSKQDCCAAKPTCGTSSGCCGGNDEEKIIPEKGCSLESAPIAKATCCDTADVAAKSSCGSSSDCCGGADNDRRLPDKGCCSESTPVAKVTCCSTADTATKSSCGSSNGCCGDADNDRRLPPEKGCSSKSAPVAKATCCSSTDIQAKLSRDTSSGCCSGDDKIADKACSQSVAYAGASCCDTATTAAKPSCGTSDGCCRDEDDINVVLKKCCQSEGTSVAKPKCCGTNDKATDECCKAPLATLAATSGSDIHCTDKCCEDNTSCDATPESGAGGCVDHLQLALDRYEAALRRGLCLCRMAIEQLGFNCCKSDPAQGVTRAVKGGCNAGVLEKNATDLEVNIHSRCSSDLPKKEAIVVSSVEHNQNDLDIEAAAGREHVVLNVSGMTCTGCSKKMMNVLAGVRGLSNAQVTFVSGSAEFDLDSSVCDNVEQVVLRIEKETGFRCLRIISGRQELSVLMTAATARQMHETAMLGLMSVTKGKKGLYTIAYDPTLVGARSLLPPDATLAPPSDDASIAEGKRRLIETACSTVLAAILTIPVVVLEWSDTPVPHRKVSIIALVLGTCVQIIAIPEFYVGALKSLIYSHVIEMDMLVVISITAAYVYSVVAFGLQRAGISLEQEAFFETSTMLITLVLLGRLIAAWARMRAVSAVSLRSLQADSALLVGHTGETTEIDARLLHFGDQISIPPHARIVTDGQVVSGVSEVDESMVTGESLPVAKQVGDKVIAGTINGSGVMQVAITRLPGENSITDIAKLVENAVASKPRVQDLADRVASWFIPVVVGIAILVFCIWVAIAIEVRDRNAGGAIGLSITYAIAVLAISCPCALGLAVPMVLVIAGGIAARAGVIIKAADAIERSYKITDVVFDKTGTLTEGDLQVVRESTMSHEITLSDEETRALTFALVTDNPHPVSVSVAAYLAATYPKQAKKSLQSIVSIPGAGIEAQYGDINIKAGNPYWLEVESHPEVTHFLQDAMTTFCITLNGKLVAVYGLQSTLRSNASSVIAELNGRGITCHIVSGDNSEAVSLVASSLNIPPANITSRSSPAQKQQYVQRLQSTHNKKVLFLGDGTNDAVAIAQADVGVQMGSTSDVTGAVADVVLLSHRLESVIFLLELSRAAVWRIVFNFVWSAVYNVFAILLAAGAFVRVRIPPAYAGLGEMVSVVPVIVAAATLGMGLGRGQGKK